MNPDEMRAEMYYDGIVVSTVIHDMIENIEWNMEKTKSNDPYFVQLSIEKFTLEQLLLRISEDSTDNAIPVLEEFASEMQKCARQNDSPNNNYTFTVARDAAQSILDGFYFD